MTDPGPAPVERVLAVARDYDDLHRACRARAEELNISRDTIDTIGGLADRHASKLLSPSKIRSMTQSTMGPILGALALKIHVLEDLEQLERIRKRLTPRDKKRANSAASKPLRIPKKVLEESIKNGLSNLMRMLGSKGGRARVERMNAKQLSRAGKRAIRARWRKRNDVSGQTR